MAKQLLSEAKLLEVINAAIAEKWTRSDCTCDVGSLREVALPDRNWEVAGFGVGGSTLNCSAECDALRQRVLGDLVEKYDVQWT